MAKLSLVLTSLIVAAVIATARGVCDVTACQNKLPNDNGTVQERCNQAREAIACAQTNILSHPDCDENIKVYVREQVKEGRKLMDSSCGTDGGAAVLTSSLTVCLGLTGLICFLTSFK